jgi:hypothetical protein
MTNVCFNYLKSNRKRFCLFFFINNKNPVGVNQKTPDFGQEFFDENNTV